MKEYLYYTILILFWSSQLMFGQEVNSITIQPINPTPNDIVYVVSDFSYNGNCEGGLITGQIIYNGAIITILPEYCGYGEANSCNAVDTFSLGQLPIGEYNINIEYHQGTVCGGNFDTVIANTNIEFQVESTLSIGSEDQVDKEIRVFPNPTSDFIIIKHKELIQSIKLFDLNGKELKITIDANTIDISSLSSGLYLLDIQLENGSHFIKKIIKK